MSESANLPIEPGSGRHSDRRWVQDLAAAPLRVRGVVAAYLTVGGASLFYVSALLLRETHTLLGRGLVLVILEPLSFLCVVALLVVLSPSSSAAGLVVLAARRATVVVSIIGVVFCAWLAGALGFILWELWQLWKLR